MFPVEFYNSVINSPNNDVDDISDDSNEYYDTDEDIDNRVNIIDDVE